MDAINSPAKSPSSHLNIVTVIGARPQFIKAAAVSRVARERTDLSEFILHTGQHFDANMSAVFFEELDIPKPDIDLAIGGGSHGAMTGRQLEQIERVLLDQKPDWVLVYGDTNSTLAGALAAAKLHIPVAHVEAGLRSFNRRMPEEINRVVADHVANVLFAPTELACANLRNEGVPESRIRRSGDVMYDAALFYGERAEARSDVLQRLDLEPHRFLLLTVHRAENTDDPQCLRTVVEALSTLARGRRVVWPLHPRTAKAMRALGLETLLAPGIQVIEPVGYLDMVQLERHAAAIVTDSGGVQKEAFFYRVPCVTLRSETEWQELVDSGWNRLAPPQQGDPAVIVAAVEAAIGARESGASPAAPPFYGTGQAAAAILTELSRSR